MDRPLPEAFRLPYENYGVVIQCELIQSILPLPDGTSEYFMEEIMAAYDVIDSLTLKKNAHQPLIFDYSAEVSFEVSFGKVSFTMSGSVDSQKDPPQSAIYETVLSQAIEELRKTPRLFEVVSRYEAWDAAGKPPYAAWCIANYPKILN